MWLLFFALERSCAIVQCVWLWFRKYLWVLLLKVYVVRKAKFAWNVDNFYIEIVYLGERWKVFLNECQNNLYGVNGMIWYWLYLL